MTNWRRNCHCHSACTTLSVEDRKRATRLGANAYLVKTEFHSESLLEVVRRFVSIRG